MKKTLSLLAGVLFLAVCSADSAPLKGREYKMLNAPHNAEITLGFDANEPRFFRFFRR